MSNKIWKDSVAILMPCALDTVEAAVMHSVVCLSNFATYHGYTVRAFNMTNRMLVHSARNTLADAFLKSDCEWAFWMDSDMILEPKTIPMMVGWLKRQKGLLATGIYYQRQGSHKPVIYVRDPKTMEGQPLHPNRMPDDYSHSHIIPAAAQTEPFKCDAAGFGCFVTHRDAFSGMEKPYFNNWFFKDDKEVSEDFYFCIKARSLGHDIWVVPALRCGHIADKQVIYREDFVPPKEGTVQIQVESVAPQQQYELKKIQGGRG